MTKRTGEIGIKNLANIITSTRILFSLIMLLVPPFSGVFWLCYLSAGLSDVLDGVAARVLRQESPLGAMLDSLADLVFAVVIAAILLQNVSLPTWLWVWITAIALLRFTAYGIGYRKYRSFSSLHTYANKAVGGLIFLLPLLYLWLGLGASGVLLCAVSTLAAVEELAITVKSKTLSRDRKSIFIQ